MANLNFDRSVAIVIGINRYGHGIPALRSATADAQAIAHLLSQEHGYKAYTLLDNQATGAQLQQLLHKALPKLLTPQSRLLFYFAGHGIALNGDDGPAGYLIPQDARAAAIDSYLPMQQLHDALTDLPCRHFLAIFDCCFAGAFRWASTRRISRTPTVIHRERFDRFQQDPAWQVITSASYDQEALDVFHLADQRGDAGQQHSPFAQSLIQALTGAADSSPPAQNGKPAGDGIITATELYLYLRDQVETLTDGPRRQTPEISSLRNHDKGEYIFLTPGHALNLPPAPPLNRASNPYRGLESFEEQHAALFFGRRDRITELKQRITDHPLTIVVGASGSGKSSLVKAGLLPQLRPSPQWKILEPVRPGSSPLELFDRLTQELNGSTAKTIQATETGPETWLKALSTWTKAHPQQKLLFVIDQFEELLTLGDREENATQCLALLEQSLTLAPEQLRLVITLRADFEPQFQDIAFPNRWPAARFILPPMSRADLRDAIEQPASAKVMYFQSNDPRQPLVDKIIDEVADMPGALPLLSFTLSELYLKFLERQRVAQQQGEILDRAILESDYRALGGVARSLTQRADQECDRLVNQDPAYSDTIRHVMLRMVALGSGELARRRVPLAELDYPEQENERVKTVIQRYSKARLLVEGQDLLGQPYVEPAHDALVRGWQKLLLWQRQEENLGLQRRLTPAALEWQREQQAKFLWHRDPRLEVLGPVLNSDRPWLNRLETEFVQRSFGRKRLNQKLWIGGTLTVLGLISAGLLAALWSWRGQIIQTAQTNQEVARSTLRRNDTLDGLVNSLAAGRSLDHPLLRFMAPNAAVREQIQGTLQWAMLNVREQNRLLGHSGPVRSQWSSDGQYIASAGEDGWLRLWSADGRELGSWQADEQRLWQVSFSPDSQRIATAGEDGLVKLWSLSGELQAQFKGHQGSVRYVRFSPDGQYLASAGGEDGKALIWDLRNGNSSQPISVFQVHPAMVKSIYFHPQKPWVVTTDPVQIKIWTLQGQLLQSFDQHAWTALFTPDGDRVVAAGDDGSVGVWAVTAKDPSQTPIPASASQPIQLWPADEQRLWHLSLTADGQQIATTGEDGVVKLWSLSGQRLAALQNHTGPARSASFHPDTTRLVSSGDDGSSRIWSAMPQAFASLPTVPGAMGGVRFLDKGQQLVAGAQDGKLRRWSPLDNTVEQQPLSSKALLDVDGTERWLAHLDAEGRITLRNRQETNGTRPSQFAHKEARALALSPDHQWLASAGLSQTLHLWNLQSQQFYELKGQNQSIQALRFSADSQQLATAGSNGLVELWSVLEQRPIQQLQEHIGQVHDVDFHPLDESQLASAGADGTIRLWNLETGRSVGTPFQVYNQQILAVAFSPDGLTLASGDRTGALQLWDMVGKKATDDPLRATWESHTDAINDIQFHPDGGQLATAASDGLVKLWALDSLEQLMQRGCAIAHGFLEQDSMEASQNAICPGRAPSTDHRTNN